MSFCPLRLPRRRPCPAVWLLACCALSVALFGGTALARLQEQPPTLSTTLLQSENPSAFSSEIERYLDFHMQRLFGTDVSEVSQAREMLGAPLRAEASVTFRNLYADYLLSRLQRRLGGAPTFNQLNAAIVAEKVARMAQSSRLAPLLRQVIEDDDAAVALWGLKAAYIVFPTLSRSLPAGERDALISAVVAAARRFPENGPVAEEAFKTLSMRTTESRPPSGETLAQAAPVVTPAMNELIRFRVGQYRPNQPPPIPLAENAALVFLTNIFVWPNQPPEQRSQTVMTLRDLMLQATITANNLPQNSDLRVQVVELLKRIGSAFEGISGPAQRGGQPVHPEVHRAAQQLRQSTSRPSPAVLEQYVADLRTAVEVAFPGLPAPVLSSLAAAEQTEDPATGPATDQTTQPQVDQPQR